MIKTCRALLILLSFILLSQTFYACNKNKNDPNLTSEQTTNDSIDTKEQRPPLDIPDVTFPGTTFNVLVPTELEYDFIAEGINGNSINDAIFKRNSDIEQRLDITFNYITESGGWPARTAYNNLIRASVSSQDGSYDLVSGIISCVIPASSEGIFLDVSELDYVNLDNPWWVDNLFNELNINGKLFALSGDALLSFYRELNVMYCNLDLLEQYSNDTNIYDIVRNGDWTFEKMCELAIPIRGNNDGNDIMDPAIDTFGFISINVPNRSWATAFNVSVIERDSEGELNFANLSEKFTDMYNMLYSTFSVNDNFHIDPSAKPTPNNNFADGRSLFLLSYINATETIKQMQDDYAILPMPKFDKQQNKYYTQVGTSSAMLFVPTDVKDSELSSIVCEALSYYNHFDVVPQYYDEVLKVQYARNENVSEMLNIIRDTATLKFQYAYSSEFSPMIFSILEMSKAKMDKYAGVVASHYESNQSLWKTKLKIITDAYGNIN